MRIQVSAFLLVMLMSLAQAVNAQGENDEGTMDAVREAMQSLSQDLTEANAEQREELMTDIEGVLSVVDDRLMTLENRLEEKWDTADRLARVQAQTAVASLRRERARVLEWYGRMKDSRDGTWESMKDGFDDSFNDLSDAWKSAEENVRKAVTEG